MGKFTTHVCWISVFVVLACAGGAREVAAPVGRPTGRDKLCPENERVVWEAPPDWTPAGTVNAAEPLYDTPAGQQTLCEWSAELWERQQEAVRLRQPIPSYPTGIAARDQKLAWLKDAEDRAGAEEAEASAAAAVQRQREEAARADAEALERQRQDAQAQRVAFARAHIAEIGGLRLCELAEQEAELRRAMRDERRAGQISGAVDLSELNRIGYDLAQAENARAHTETRVRELSGKTPRCDAAGKTALRCSREPATCGDDAQRELTEAMIEGYDLIGRP